MIAEGKTNKEIATALGLSTYTVESHRGRIMEAQPSQRRRTGPLRLS
jgi:DNA-binding NarL/FixJ family response regulator